MSFHRGEYNVRYYQINKEQMLKAQNEYNALHRDERNAYSRQYYKNNRVILLEKCKEKRRNIPNKRPQGRPRKERPPSPVYVEEPVKEPEPIPIWTPKESDFTVCFD